ncbi:SH3 domain-containing protein [Rugosimonospora acidiphila]|uniref:SH3 domain-containing protein n=1 Tax=Rugosimonospora acidiphila TaxID=556531 RepID=A0ABP9RUB5_9ACTN
MHTAGASLTVRSGPHTTSAAVGSVANGATVNFSCQTTGDTVTGTYGKSNIWDKISTGYVSDTYVYTGSDGTVAPACGAGQACSAAGLADPNGCAAAVSWAKSHETTAYHADYYNRCDHVMALAYGFPASGSTTALVHWQAVPAKYKHAGDRTVPAGGLAFFGGGAGHVMISIGGGKFVSSDIHGDGTLTETTIAQIEDSWGKPYLGWTQPWFQYNH